MKEYDKMTKKEKKEYNAKQRVDFGMKLGTVSFKDKKHPSRQDRKKADKKEMEY